jgi:hypothetical protein
MQLSKSSSKPRNWIKDMIWVAFGVFLIAILAIFFQNFEKTPQQTEVVKDIKIK